MAPSPAPGSVWTLEDMEDDSVELLDDSELLDASDLVKVAELVVVVVGRDGGGGS